MTRRRARAHLPLLTGVLSALALAGLDALIRDERVPRGDDLIYERMAQHPFATHTFPFAYRFAVPTLVHVMPFGHTTSFQLLTYLAAGVAAGALAALLGRLGAPPALAAGLGLGLALSPPLLVVALRQGRNPDAASVAVLMVGALFIRARRPVALGVTLVLGATVRESTLFLIPWAHLAWSDRPLAPRALARTAAVGGPALALYAALRTGLPTVGRELVPGYAQGALSGRLHVIRQGIGQGTTEIRRLASAFGPLWLTLPAGLARSRYVRAGIPVLLLCALSMTFALDWGRIVFLAAPVVYAAAGVVLRDRARLAILAVAALIALDVGYAVYMHVSGVANGIEMTHAPPYPVR